MKIVRKIKRFLRKINWIEKIRVFFIRYTTVKSRYLDHSYTDPSELLPYTMFEILEEFLVIECDLTENYKPGPKCISAWYDIKSKNNNEKWDAYRIIVNNRKKYVFDEMTDILKWWRKVYIPYSDGTHPTQIKLRENMDKYDDKRPFHEQWTSGTDEYGRKYRQFKPVFIDRKKYHKYLDKLMKFEEDILMQRKEYMKRLVEVHEYMWT